MQKSVEENEAVVLIDEKGTRIPLIVKDKNLRIKRLGIYNPKELIGKKYYEKIEIGNRKFMIFIPSIFDKISAIERKAQIILPKDGLFIIYYCDIKSGDRIVEGGSGSGALTMLLAHFVKPKGRVISYEMRDDFAKVAQRNLENAGLNEYIGIKKGDITSKIDEKDVDAVVLDVPNPWDVVQNAYKALKLGGHLACYSPSMNQVEKTVKEMRMSGFFGIKTLETIQREMIVGEKGTRPSFEGLGHTGYVTIGRKIK